MKIIRVVKVLLALGFLVIAYDLTTDTNLFGVPAEVPLLIASVLAFIIIFIDFRARQKRTGS